MSLEPEMLPAQVHLSDLSYTSLTPHETAKRRLPMLEQDGDRYEPHSYEQLMAAYRHVGDDDAARLVQLAKQRWRRNTLAWYGRLWGYVQDATVGYWLPPDTRRRLAVVPHGHWIDRVRPAPPSPCQGG